MGIRKYTDEDQNSRTYGRRIQREKYKNDDNFKDRAKLKYYNNKYRQCDSYLLLLKNDKTDFITKLVQAKNLNNECRKQKINAYKDLDDKQLKIIKLIITEILTEKK